MNAKIYITLFISLIGLNIGAMENQQLAGVKRKNSSEVSESKNIKKTISIEIAMPRNAVGAPAIEELDLSNEEPIRYETFKELITAKHAKNDSYLLARAVTQVKDGILVQYVDAHALNKALFGTYPLRELKELGHYQHPVSKNRMQLLDYYECEPQAKVFKFMCAYAALRSKDESKSIFLRRILYANQEEDLRLAASSKNNIGYAYQHGEGVEVDYAKAMKRYEQAANQKDDLGVAATAKNNIGYMYQVGLGIEADGKKAEKLYQEVITEKHDWVAVVSATLNLGAMYDDGDGGVEVDYAKASKLYQQVAYQKHDLGVAACATFNLGVMYQNGNGVKVNYVRAKEFYEQAANQKNDLWVAANAKNRLGIMHQYGLGVPVNYAKAEELYQEIINQKHNLGAVARAKNNLAYLYQAKAKKLCQQVANQTDDLEAAEKAKIHLADIETLMKKYDEQI